MNTHPNVMQQEICGQICNFYCDICKNTFYRSGDYRIIDNEYYCEKCWKENDKKIIKTPITLNCITYISHLI